MKPFQYIGLGFTGVLIALSVISLIRNRGRPLAPLFWLFIWCSAALAIAAPNATTQVANVFGVVRGADFISYCGVLGGLIGFSLVYLRFRHLERQLTLLVRELALARIALDRHGSTPISELRRQSVAGEEK